MSNDFDNFEYDIEPDNGKQELALDAAINAAIAEGETEKKVNLQYLRHRVNENDPLQKHWKKLAAAGTVSPRKHATWLVAVLNAGEITSDGVYQTAGISIRALDIHENGGWMGKVKVMERVPVESNEPMPETFKNTKAKRKWLRAQKYAEVPRWRHAEVISGPFYGITPALAEAEAGKKVNTDAAIARVYDKHRKPQLIALALSAPPVAGDISYWSQEREILAKEKAEENGSAERAREKEALYAGTDFGGF